MAIAALAHWGSSRPRPWPSTMPGIDTTYAAVLLGRGAGDRKRSSLEKCRRAGLYPASLTKVMTVLLGMEDIESGKIALSATR